MNNYRYYTNTNVTYNINFKKFKFYLMKTKKIIKTIC